MYLTSSKTFQSIGKNVQSIIKENKIVKIIYKSNFLKNCIHNKTEIIDQSLQNHAKFLYINNFLNVFCKVIINY